MSESIVVDESTRKTLLSIYRSHRDPKVRLRAHIVLLLAGGHPWSLVCGMLFCSTRTISKWKRRFDDQGVEGLFKDRRHEGRPWVGRSWPKKVAELVLDVDPRKFGFLRSRWTCKLVTMVLLETYKLQVSEETVRRWLHGEGLVWRRPRPVLVKKDPEHDSKLEAIRDVLLNLAEDEIAVFQDEVDVNTNPKIGAMWMPRGQQAHVETPGNNEKRYLAGSLDWQTGHLLMTGGAKGQRRNSALFIQHLKELNKELSDCRTIHVICDNARFHDCGAVNDYLQSPDNRIQLHFLPRYSPQANPIERVWWNLHENITRNHRCKSMEELIDLVMSWLDQRAPFVVEDQEYHLPLAA